MIDIATRATQALVMPDGNRYEFFGKTYYGVCSTLATTQTKVATVTGFNSSCLNEGVRVVVRFTDYQGYVGTPKLNVSSTGAKDIQCGVGAYANRGEWLAGAIVSFIYYSDKWVIENGQHASELSFGKVALSSYSANNNTYAATTSSVAELGYNIFDSGWNGGYDYCETIIDTTTPTLSEWTTESGMSMLYFQNIQWSSRNYGRFSYNRIVKIIYGSNVFYKTIDFRSDYSTGDVLIEFSFNNKLCYITFIPIDNILMLSINTELAGAYLFKVEFFYYNNAGFVPYPIFRDTLSNYLTLADLPIYDGTVV